MILCCPECDTRFRVPDNLIGGGGRKVRCGACGHIWHVSGDQSGEESLSPVIEQALSTSPAPAAAPRDKAAHVASEPVEQIARVDDAISQPGPDDPEPPARSRSDEDRSLEAEITETMRRLRDEESEMIAGSAPPPAPLGRPPRMSIIAGWVLWLLLVLSLPLGWVMFGDVIRDVWPASRGIDHLFAHKDSDSPPALSGSSATPLPTAAEAFDVRIDNSPEWQATDNGWTLGVGGEISNRAAVAVSPGKLMLVLIDAEDREIRRAAVALAEGAMAPGETRRFRVAIEDAPAETVGILHEWQ